MSFCSLDFIFLFLPVTVLLHAVVGQKYKNAILLLASIVFYALLSEGHADWMALLLVSSVVNWILGRAIGGTEGKYRKRILWLGVVYDASTLLFFKYFASAFNGMAASLGYTAGLLIPAGLSFYTFRNISYLHQVYRGTAEPERSYIDYGAYLLNFTQIAMGPIQTYSDFLPKLKYRPVRLYRISEGLEKFILGFGLKQIYANRLGSIWNGIDTVGFDGISTPLAWLGVIGYSMQLYFDFYGYSLMAAGIGEMLGYETPDNFLYPYTASSMSDFWRRWHITLGSWFRENVYIPLGGNRVSKPKLYRNLLVVWLLTGIWHGDSFTFVLWGLFLFGVIALEKSGKIDKLLHHKVFCHVWLLPLILFSWTVFRLPTLSDLWVYLNRLFPFFRETPEYVFRKDYLKYVKSTGWILLTGIPLCTPLPRRLYEYGKKKSKWLAVLFLLLVFWYAVYCSACGADDVFLYSNY